MIDHRFEWYVPPSTPLLDSSIVASTGAWTAVNFGNPSIYPTYIFSIFWQPFLARFFGVESVDRTIAVVAIGGAFVTCGFALRSLRIDFFWCVCGSVIYAMSPFVVFHLAAGHLPYLQAYALAPLVAWAARRGGTPAVVFSLLCGALCPQPQAIITLFLASAAIGFFYRGARGVAGSLVFIAGFVFANAFWIVPNALRAKDAFATLHRTQPVAVDAASLIVRSVWTALALRGYVDSVETPIFGWLPAVVSASVPVFAFVIAGRMYADVRVRFAIAVGVASFLAVLGPVGILRAPILWLYANVPASSLYKENYHFGFAFALLLPLLFALALHALARRSRPLAIGIGVAGMTIWAGPIVWSGDLGGWIAPHISRIHTFEQADLERPMFLPAIANIHNESDPMHDGVDAQIVYDGGFGNWSAMSPIGSALLHGVAPDRAPDLPDLAFLAGVNRVDLRPWLRSARVIDNPSVAEPNLIRAGFLHDPRDRLALIAPRRTSIIRLVTTLRTFDGDIFALRGADAIRFDDWTNVQNAVDGSGARHSGDDVGPRCFRCQTVEAGASGDVKFASPFDGWALGNSGANWVPLFDVLDTGSTFNFAATRTSAPLSLTLPCAAKNEHVHVLAATTSPLIASVDRRSYRLRATGTAFPLRERWWDLGEHRCSNELAVTVHGLGDGTHLVSMFLSVPDGSQLAASRDATATRLGVSSVVQAKRLSDSAFALSIEPAPRYRALLLDVSPDLGWEIHSAPTVSDWEPACSFGHCAIRNWQRVRLDGMFQGWLIPPYQGGHLLLYYAPSLSYRVALHIEIVVASVMAIAGCGIVIVRRRRHRVRS